MTAHDTAAINAVEISNGKRWRKTGAECAERLAWGDARSMNAHHLERPFYLEPADEKPESGALTPRAGVRHGGSGSRRVARGLGRRKPSISFELCVEKWRTLFATKVVPRRRVRAN